MKTHLRQFMFVSVAVAFSFGARATSVVNTMHNLSAAGPGAVKATSENDACIFCHTVHRTTGETPLWSHTMSSVTNYTVYSSPTLKAMVGQPDGSSRLCLSCHDGTVALGMVSSRTTTIQMQGGVTTMPSGPGNLGTDLSGDHPISFVYDQNLASLDSHIKDPTTVDRKLKLDHFQKLQCSTCHNPHDDQFGNFLVMDNTGSAMCLACHTDPDWQHSAHGSSATPLVGTLAEKLAVNKRSAKSVAANGCENCHTSHRAESKARLLVNAREEQTCFTCHNGGVVKQNLSAEFTKPSAHPVMLTSSQHRSNEDLMNGPRHAACSDCHNSHASSDKTARAPNSSGAIAGVKGVASTGAVIEKTTREYELCFRCHADSLNRGPATVQRQIPETNTRIEFNPANRSFHPIEAVGKNPNVPSLITPWNSSSLIYCTDCHNNDQGPKAGGTGPDGPHGSIFAPLLERQQVLTDFGAENAASYALCYKCHSRDSILADQSFPFHRKHVVDDQTACTTCHDSHGVAANSRLINFNLNYVTPSASGPVSFMSRGVANGTCTLKCHGFDHVGTSYSPSGLLFSKPATLRKR